MIHILFICILYASCIYCCVPKHPLAWWFMTTTICSLSSAVCSGISWAVLLSVSPGHSCNFLVICQLGWSWLVQNGLTPMSRASAGMVVQAEHLFPCDLSPWVYLQHDGLRVPEQNKAARPLKVLLWYHARSTTFYWPNLPTFKSWANTLTLDGRNCREFWSTIFKIPHF